jgi:16S rRNA (cytidine1402-2'-O)-methyltransferase
MPGKIYLIPSILSPEAYAPISSEIRSVIPLIDVFLVENLRTARRYISGLKTGLVIEELTFEVLDKNTPAPLLDKYIDAVKNGSVAGILSEAGCPGIADPGAKMVNLAHKHGIEVIPLSGPSSIFLALMASGLNGQSFTFHGYLPIDKKQREVRLKQLDKLVRTEQATQIFIETPYRNEALFSAISEACNPNTLLCIACDLTGDNGFVQTLPVKGWKGKKPDIHKKPCVFLLGPEN